MESQESRMCKELVAELWEMLPQNSHQQELSIALAEKYNLEVIVMRQGGKGRIEGVVPRININKGTTRQVLIYKGELRPVGHLGIYNGSRAVKVRALRNDLEKNSYGSIDEKKVREVKELFEGYKILLKGELMGVKGVYELERAVSDYYKVKGHKGKMYVVEDVRVQKK